MTTSEALEQIQNGEVVTNTFPVGLSSMYYSGDNNQVIHRFQGYFETLTEEEFLTQYSQEPYEGNWEFKYPI